jgi:WD40 repeat protein
LRHARTVQKAVFSPDGRRVVTVSLDLSARIWDASSGEALTHPLMHDSPVSQVCFSADGRRILTSCWSGTTRLWDADTGRPLTEWLDAGGGGGFSACFDSTGRRIVSGAYINGIVRVWDTPPAPTPVPPWFLSLAEAVAGTRLSTRGSTELVSRRGEDVAQRLQPAERGDFYERLSQWFLADPSQRAASPF